MIQKIKAQMILQKLMKKHDVTYVNITENGVHFSIGPRYHYYYNEKYSRWVSSPIENGTRKSRKFVKDLIENEIITEDGGIIVC